MKNSRHASDTSDRPSINFLRSSQSNSPVDPSPADVPVEQQEEEHHDHESLNSGSVGRVSAEHLREYASDASLHADSHSDLGKGEVESLQSDANAANDGADGEDMEDLNLDEFAVMRGEMADGRV